jgi:hypothetical protein
MMTTINAVGGMTVGIIVGLGSPNRSPMKMKFSGTNPRDGNSNRETMVALALLQRGSIEEWLHFISIVFRRRLVVMRKNVPTIARTHRLAALELSQYIPYGSMLERLGMSDTYKRRAKGSCYDMNTR